MKPGQCAVRSIDAARIADPFQQVALPGGRDTIPLPEDPSSSPRIPRVELPTSEFPVHQEVDRGSDPGVVRGYAPEREEFSSDFLDLEPRDLLVLDLILVEQFQDIQEQVMEIAEQIRFPVLGHADDDRPLP